MPPDRPWRKSLDQWSDALEPLADTFDPVDTEPPLFPAEIAQLEKLLARPLPLSLRRFALEDAAAVKFYWMLPEDHGLPDPFGKVLWGQLELDIRELAQMDEHRASWATDVFPNADDPYNALWHNSLAFHHIANGDLLAFDLSTTSDDPPVIYLSHEGGDDHGVKLGNNFADFLDRFTRLGCPGPEDWLLTRFFTGSPPILDPTSSIARDWRSLFKLPN